MTTSLISCSVQVLTRNSEKTIVHCLDTLTAFGEVIVQDGHSTDRTVEIAKGYPNVTILSQNPAYLDTEGKIRDFAAIRNESIAAAKYDWVLVVDADEGTKPDMVEEVQEIVVKNEPGVYRAFRRFIIEGKKVMYCAGYPAYQIRLFHRSCVEGYAKPIHERLVVHPGVPLQILRAELPIPLPPAKDLNAKYERYLRMEVERLGVMPWKKWLRWILYRNLRSALAVAVLTLRVQIIPKYGKRMPIAYEWQAIRQSLRTIIHTFPPLARHRHSKSEARNPNGISNI